MIYKSLLKSTFNTREPGGFALAHGVIKRGIMWRSDRLSEYDPDDEQTLLERHMTTLIDMRTEDEVRRIPCAYADRQGFDYHHCAITEGSMPPSSLDEVPVSYMSIALSDGMREVFKTAAALMLSVCGADRRDSWVITP